MIDASALWKFLGIWGCVALVIFGVLIAQTVRLHTRTSALELANAHLRAASIELEAASAALTAQNVANARRIADARAAAALAVLAEEAAQSYAASLRGEVAQWRAKVGKARNNPTCDALLRADVAKVCGL